MKISTPLLLSLAGAVIQTQASPLSVADNNFLASIDLPNLEEVDMISIGPVTPGGPDVTLTGTAKSIYEQILVLNPSYNPADFGGEPLKPEPTLAEKALSQLEGRTWTGGCCRCTGAPYNVEAYDQATLDGINYLLALGTRQCGTGSGGVLRAACSYNSAIWMVSRTQTATYSPCNALGVAANSIYRSCYLDYRVNGQICDSGGFCVIIGGGASC
ncbi:hypothetical protein O988_09823 [Pseudogymnoascus sp. VKM F-3808]|nr:hypothetical protein O988_09823 [Pseudogymnoascus sp. VKM F-3808]